MLDMLGPKERTKIRLSDLKGCRMTPIFFDTFFRIIGFRQSQLPFIFIGGQSFSVRTGHYSNLKVNKELQY